MPTPSPNSGAIEVSSRPHRAVAAMPEVSPASRPPSTAPARPGGHAGDAHHQPEAGRDHGLGGDDDPAGGLGGHGVGQGAVLHLGGEHQRADDRGQHGGQPGREDERLPDREDLVGVRVGLDERRQDPRQQDADDDGEGEDGRRRAQGAELDPLAPEGGGHGGEVVARPGAAVVGDAVRVSSAGRGSGGGGGVHGWIGSFGARWVVGSGGGELGAGAGHVDEDLFEGAGGLGDLGDLDAVVERDLRHRGGGRAVDGEAVAVDRGR